MSASLKRLAGLPAVIGLAALAGACAATPPTLSSAASTPLPGVTPAALHRPTTPVALSDLTGMRPADVMMLLGQPDLIHSEPPATVWQYRSADCVLNLFFYDKAGASSVTYTEAWQPSFGPDFDLIPCRDATAPLRARLLTSSTTPATAVAAGF